MSGTRVLWLLIVVGVLVALRVAHDDGSEQEPVAAPPSTTTATATATAAPLSAPDYQLLLTRLGEAVRPAVAQVNAAGTMVELAPARDALSAVLREQTSALAEIVPPSHATVPTRDLRQALGALDEHVKALNLTGLGESCGGVRPVVDDIDLALNSADLRNSITGLAAAGFQVGAFVPPAPRPHDDRHAANGTIVQRSGPKGPGKLDIDNGTDSDVAVSVVTGEPSKPQVMIYVRAGQHATVTRISGTYDVYYKSGADWDAGRRQFTRDCVFEKFDLPFFEYSNWEIELRKSNAGNASTSSVDAY